MLVMETIAKIRRAYFGHGQPIKAICRDLGVSRKVVRKVIRSEAPEFRYEREAQPLPRITVENQCQVTLTSPDHFPSAIAPVLSWVTISRPRQSDRSHVLASLRRQTWIPRDH